MAPDLASRVSSTTPARSTTTTTTTIDDGQKMTCKRILAALACAALACAARGAHARAMNHPMQASLGIIHHPTSSTVDDAGADADDCATCEAFMRHVREKLATGKVQGELANALARACKDATGGDLSQMGVCVAAGEAGIRFATKYVETHTEIDDTVCAALEMCDGPGDARFAFDVEDAATVRASARQFGTSGAVDDGEMCADCVMATNLIETELRANGTVAFVTQEVDALCAQLGAELSTQCERVVEPYVPFVLDSLADAMKDACTKIGACPKNVARAFQA